jgi:hypothetical protein
MAGDLVDDGLQGRLGFANHAIERFGERAGLEARDRSTLEPVLRDLLTQEGRVVSDRPRWARSANPADAYIQVGDWLLLICRHDLRRPGRLTVVTVLNGPRGTTWERALRRGLLGTPPPLALAKPKRSRLHLGGAAREAVRNDAGLPGWAGSRIVSALRARRAAAAADHRARVEEYRSLRAAHIERRRQARAEHERRHG